MFAIGGEAKLAAVTIETPTPRFRTAHQLFAIHHYDILVARTRAVGVTLAVRTECYIAGSLLRDNLVEFRPLDSVVVHHGTAAIRFYRCNVDSVRTYFELRVCLHRCQYSLLNISSRRRLEWPGIICVILGDLSAAFVGVLARLLLSVLLLLFCLIGRVFN